MEFWRTDEIAPIVLIVLFELMVLGLINYTMPIWCQSSSADALNPAAAAAKIGLNIAYSFWLGFLPFQALWLLPLTGRAKCIMRPGQGLFVFHSHPSRSRQDPAQRAKLPGEIAKADAHHSYPSVAPWLAATSAPSWRSAFSIFLPAASAKAPIGPPSSGGNCLAAMTMHSMSERTDENALHVKIFAHGSSYYGVARRAPAHRTTSAICLDREKCPAARRGCRAFPPRCLALGFQFIAMRARYEFADPLTLISARRTLTCRRNGLSRCFAVMPQLPTLCGSSA
jgi:hypothetical protein